MGEEEERMMREGKVELEKQREECRIEREEVEKANKAKAEDEVKERGGK